MTLVDTWAWLALAHKHDPYHALATQQHRLLHKRRARYVTTDYVLAELMGPLFIPGAPARHRAMASR
jgi:predicted nucleic acid-binding protein